MGEQATIHRRACGAVIDLALGILLGLGAVVSPGCSSVPFQSVLVQVRDRVSAEPIAGAMVRSIPHPVIHPLDLGALFRRGPTPSQALTDSAGSARLRIDTEEPFSLIVIAGGYPVSSLFFDGLDPDLDAGRWVSEPTEPGGASLEIRLDPVPSRSPDRR